MLLTVYLVYLEKSTAHNEMVGMALFVEVDNVTRFIHMRVQILEPTFVVVIGSNPTNLYDSWKRKLKSPH